MKSGVPVSAALNWLRLTLSHNCLRMITWLKINFGQWRDHVDPPNKFLRCHVSTFLTGQNKEKKVNSWQSESASPKLSVTWSSRPKSGLIDKTAQNVVKDSLIYPRSVKTVELNLFVLHWLTLRKHPCWTACESKPTPPPSPRGQWNP